jgi:cytochrome c-type biogenesis protein CcmH/NrfG
VSRKQQKKAGGTIKTETAMVAAALTFALGFLSGVGFTVYRTTSLPVPAATGVQVPQTDKQAEMLKAQVEKNPGDAKAWVRLGNHYFDSQQPRQAIRAYETALKLVPEQPGVLTDLGVMYRRAGKPKKAVEAFDRVIAMDPTQEVARFNKGVVLLHDLKDEAAALHTWEELLAINPVAMAPNGQSVDELVQHYREHGK